MAHTSVNGEIPRLGAPPEAALELIQVFRRSPIRFLKEVLGVESLWSGQEEILNLLPVALADHRPLVIGSGHALGKDFLSGAIPLWWQATRYPAKTIITGPTNRQVREIVWHELSRHYKHQLMPLGGRLLTGQLEWDEEHFILAFTTKDTGSRTGKAQGFHSPNILVIVTEAQAVEENVWQQIDGLLTSENSLLVMIGNPLTSTGRFAAALRDPLHNHVVNLDCEASPNFLEGAEIIPGLVSKQWVEDKRRLWFDKNPDHPLWRSRVKGLLPLTAVNTLFSSELVARAVNRPISEIVLRRVLGVDVARFGDDDTVIYCVESGKGVVAMEHTSKQPTTDAAGRALIMRKAQNANLICVDADGIGGGVVDMLRRDMDENVLEFHGSANAEEKEKYHNARAEAWSFAAEQLELGRMNLPDDPILHEELQAVWYQHDSRGRILLVDKDDVKATLGRSPDRADAWVLAVWALRHASPISKKDVYEEEDGSRNRVRGWMTA